MLTFRVAILGRDQAG